MGEIVLKLKSETNMESLIALLAPYIKEARIETPPQKIWKGRAEWLDTPITIDSFDPLCRD
ncbi:MAG: hypothetical protein LBC67_07860 [Spirochaetales bacterium]|jgi:hypothetical protein|nr:hypothetical protein [Spirochaetales bacterium]